MGKCKGKVVPVLNETHCHDDVRGSGGIAPRVRTLGTRCRWVVSFTSLPLYPRRKFPWYPLDRRPGGPQNRSGRGVKEKKSCSLPESHPGARVRISVTILTELPRVIIIINSFRSVAKLESRY